MQGFKYPDEPHLRGDPYRDGSHERDFRKDAVNHAVSGPAIAQAEVATNVAAAHRCGYQPIELTPAEHKAPNGNAVTDF